MTYTFIFHPSTEIVFAEAYEWYELQQTGLGERFIAAFLTKLEVIHNHPEAFFANTRKDYREAAIEKFPFLIVYKIYRKRKEIFVSSIHHERKHPAKKFKSQ